MENIIDLVLYFGILSVMFLPVTILCWFTESTRIGRRIMDWVMWKLGLDDLEDYED